MHVADSFRAARWIRMINLLLQAAFFLTLFAGLNYIALNHAWRFDVTAGRRHSLSPETKSYLERLERDVNIIVTITDSNDSEEIAQAYRDVSSLLREYTYLTRERSPGKITVQYVDVYQNSREAKALGVEQPNVVVLQSDRGRSVKTLDDLYVIKKKVSREAFKGEAVITAAILDVASAEKKKIYFLAGHGEMAPDSIDGARGLSLLRDQLRQRNYNIEGLDLNLTRKIPDDAALLVIASPTRPFQGYEEELLRTYLTTRAGRVILLVDPGQRFGLENLLFDWGVIVYDNVIIDPNPGYMSENGELILARFPPQPHPITQVLVDNGLYLLVGWTRVVNEDIGRSPDDGLSVKRLIATSKDAWGESGYRLRNAQYTPGQDLKGPDGLGVLVVSERLKPSNLPLSVPGGRLAVFGTADLITNNRLINSGNFPVFLNTVNWAVDRDTQLSIPARPVERFQLSLSQEELGRLRLGLFFIVPGAVALLGLIVYWTRRN
jgi:hypothetical protein